MNWSRQATNRAICAALSLSFALLSPAVGRAECGNADDEEMLGDWLYAQGMCQIRDQGLSALSGIGESLLATSLNVYAPGVAAIFGLGGGEGESLEIMKAEIMAAIQRNTDELHDHIQEFWDWSRNTANMDIRTSFNATFDDLQAWNGLTPEQKLLQVDTINALVSDFRGLQHGMANVVNDRDRLKWLHTYSIAIDLALALAADQASVQVVWARVSSDSRYHGDLEAYYNTISAAERDDIVLAVEQRTQALWEVILRTGSYPVFTYLSDINESFRAVADSRVSKEMRCDG